jgi:hypothetical protein
MTQTAETTEVGKTLGTIAKDILTSPKAVAEPKVNNGELLAKHGLQVMHFHPGIGLPGMTVAYRVPFRSSNVLEIATAITHPNDTFTKKIGTRIAVEAFVAGRTAYVPIVHKKKPASLTLKHYFN